MVFEPQYNCYHDTCVGVSRDLTVESNTWTDVANILKTGFTMHKLPLQAVASLLNKPYTVKYMGGL